MVKEYICIYAKMMEVGVVIYGAGNNGKYVYDNLKSRDIEVNAIADKVIGKQIDKVFSISLQNLCDRDCKEVCIVTPNKMLVHEEIRLLKTKFDLVVDNVMSMKYQNEYLNALGAHVRQIVGGNIWLKICHE